MVEIEMGMTTLWDRHRKILNVKRDEERRERRERRMKREMRGGTRRKAFSRRPNRPSPSPSPSPQQQRVQANHHETASSIPETVPPPLPSLDLKYFLQNATIIQHSMRERASNDANPRHEKKSRNKRHGAASFNS
jgi:hypothetical protein